MFFILIEAVWKRGYNSVFFLSIFILSAVFFMESTSFGQKNKGIIQ